VLPAFRLVPQQQRQHQHQQQQLQLQERPHKQQGDEAWTADSLFAPDSRPLAVPGSKSELLSALAAGTVQPFDCGVFSPSQQVRVGSIGISWSYGNLVMGCYGWFAQTTRLQGVV
jgi:hypothetical protein